MAGINKAVACSAEEINFRAVWKRVACSFRHLVNLKFAILILRVFSGVMTCVESWQAISEIKIHAASLEFSYIAVSNALKPSLSGIEGSVPALSNVPMISDRQFTISRLLRLRNSSDIEQSSVLSFSYVFSIKHALNGSSKNNPPGWQTYAGLVKPEPHSGLRGNKSRRAECWRNLRLVSSRDLETICRAPLPLLSQAFGSADASSRI